MLIQTLEKFIYSFVPLSPKEMFMYGWINWEQWIEIEENVLPSLSKSDQKQFLISLTQKLYERARA